MACRPRPEARGNRPDAQLTTPDSRFPIPDVRSHQILALVANALERAGPDASRPVHAGHARRHSRHPAAAVRVCHSHGSAAPAGGRAGRIADHREPGADASDGEYRKLRRRRLSSRSRADASRDRKGRGQGGGCHPAGFRDRPQAASHGHSAGGHRRRRSACVPNGDRRRRPRFRGTQCRAGATGRRARRQARGARASLVQPGARERDLHRARRRGPHPDAHALRDHVDVHRARAGARHARAAHRHAGDSRRADVRQDPAVCARRVRPDHRDPAPRPLRVPRAHAGQHPAAVRDARRRSSWPASRSASSSRPR